MISIIQQYHGEIMPDDLPVKFDEDASSVLRDLAPGSAHSDTDTSFSYCDADIDALSECLGIPIPWEPSKTIPFTEVVPFLGFRWNLSSKTVEIPNEKKEKYKNSIRMIGACHPYLG